MLPLPSCPLREILLTLLKSLLFVLLKLVMPFKFRHLCDLLQSLDENRVKKKATSALAKRSDIPIIISWFNKHDRQIPRHGSAAVAFLSCLFPERRADRVYNVQEKRLEMIIGRTLGLSTIRMKHLRSWRDANGADFAQTVQNVMREAEFSLPRPEHEVTLEEIDGLFDRTAATYNGSSPELRRTVADPIGADEALPLLFRRLQSNEAKWLVRMFLKRYTPIEMPEMLVMHQFHCLLPDIFCLQNCFTAAIRCLDDPAVSHFCPRPRNPEHEQLIKAQAAPYLKPQIGVMIQRSPYYKARNIQHCCDMAGRRRISVERKYDGEYCQVHIDVSKGKEAIKIFSKSGKDSTNDRVRLHGAIQSALKLGKKDCPVKKQCILEGELLIWHEKEQRIQPFEKIRKHVTRNGRFLGNDQDSPRDLQERVMIMFYDLLLYDDIVCLNESLEQRRSRLRSFVRRVPGQAELGYREKINFASSDAKALIRLAFAKSISKGWEGFVLKGCDDPYFSLAGSPPCIKLKKDYITGLGDMADLAVIGGRRYARDEHALNIGKLNWTTFYLGCLENKQEVRRFGIRPRFRIVGVVSAAKQTLSADRTHMLNERGQFERIPYASFRAEMEVIMDQSFDPPTELFKNPFVVEVVGGGFDKPANVTYRCLRFPRVTKIHEDRLWHDIMDFAELQKLADEAQSMAENEDSQEDREWIERLIQADPKSKYVNQNSANTSAGRASGSVRTNPTTQGAPRSPLSPLLIRIDTQELTEEERHDRALLDGCDRSSPILHRAPTNSLKRKSHTQGQSPNANISTKRVKISTQPSCNRDNNLSQTQTTQPPLCQPKLRQPLAEIQNPLPARTPSPTRLQHSNQVPVYPGQQQAGQAKSPSNKDQSIHTAPKVQRSIVSGQLSKKLRAILADAPLPTPPTSSPEDDRGCSICNLSKPNPNGVDIPPAKQAAGHHNPEPINPDTMSRNDALKQSATSITTLQALSPLIFLSPTIPQTLSTNAKQQLLSTLSTTKHSFTFSHDLFLGSIQNAPPHTAHTALVSVSNPRDAVNEICGFYREITKRFGKGQAMSEGGDGGEGRLLFLDWKVLKLEDVSVDKLKECFGGCLVWDGDGVVRDIWKWREVMDVFNGV